MVSIQMISSRQVFAATLFGFVVFSPTAALACRCAGQLDNIRSAVNDIGRDIVSVIKQAAGQISANIELSSRAAAKLADTTYQRMVERERQKISGRSAQDFAPSPQACATLTGISTMAAVTSNSSASALQQAILGTRWNDGSRTGGAATRADAARFLSERLRTKYCSPRERELGLCSVDQAYEGAMLRPMNTLLGPMAYEDQRQADAARDAALLLTNPLPPGPPPKDWYAGDTQGRDVARQSSLAMIGLAQGVFQESIAERDPIKSDQWAQYVAGWIKATNPNGVSATGNTSSRFALLQSEVERRHSSTAWHLALRAMAGVELQREAVAIAALNAFLTFETNRRLEKLGILMAAQVSQKGRDIQEALATTRDGGQQERTVPSDGAANVTTRPVRP